MSGNNKVKIYSYTFFIYFMYVIFIVGVELADCFCFAAGLPQVTISSRLLVLLFCGLFFMLVKKNFEIQKVRLNWQLFVGIAVIFIVGILKSATPDTSYDTGNYHLIAQRPGFTDFFTEHFAKGFFQVWGFRLGDRIFWGFRQFLGYRFGTMLNVLIIILLFLQIYGLLGRLRQVAGDIVEKQAYEKVAWALLIVLSSYNIEHFGSYYVDLLALPIGVEVLSKMLETFEKKQTYKDILYFAFLNGIWFAFKMTNIVFVAPCVILYIVRVRKEMRSSTFCLSGILAALPCISYLFFNFICTGNPVFPYYNSLFQSDYFRVGNFKDGRWGGTNFFEKFFWLFYMVFRPEYRQTEKYDIISIVLVLGIVGLAFLLCTFFGHMVKKTYVFGAIEMIAVLLIGSAVLWGITTGYTRYFLWGILLLGILAYYFVVLMMQINKTKVLSRILTAVVLVGMSLMLVRSFGKSTWSYGWKREVYARELSKVFTDRDYEESNSCNIDMFYLTEAYYNGIAELIGSNIYTYVAEYEGYLDNKEISNNALKEHGRLLDGDVYDIKNRSLGGIANFVDIWNAYGMRVEKFETLDIDLGEYVLVRLEKDSRDCNTIYFCDERISIAADKVAENAKLKFLWGNIYSWADMASCELVVLKGVGREKVEVSRVEVSGNGVENFCVNLGSIDENTEIELVLYDTEGNIGGQDSAANMFVINLVVEEG